MPLYSVEIRYHDGGSLGTETGTVDARDMRAAAAKVEHALLRRVPHAKPRDVDVSLAHNRLGIPSHTWGN